MTKKPNGNVREGDIKESNPLRRVRIEEARRQEADQELKEYQKHFKDWEESQGYCCDWDTK